MFAEVDGGDVWLKCQFIVPDLCVTDSRTTDEELFSVRTDTLREARPESLQQQV